MEEEKVLEEAVIPPEVVEAKVVILRLAESAAEVAGFADYHNAYKKQFSNLSRRIRLLAPMFEELRESKDPIDERTAKGLASLERALDAAKQLLRLGCEGSKIFLVPLELILRCCLLAMRSRVSVVLGFLIVWRRPNLLEEQRIKNRVRLREFMRFY